MSYYFVVNYDVTDQEMYNQYLQGVRPTLRQYGAKPLVVDHQPNDIEGQSAHTLWNYFGERGVARCSARDDSFRQSQLGLGRCRFVAG